MDAVWLREQLQSYEREVEGVHISATERATYKRCRRLWDYTSRNRQDLAPVVTAKALAFGTGIHEALAAYYGAWHGCEPPLTIALEAWGKFVEGWRDSVSLWEDESLSVDKASELGAIMLKGYAEWAKTKDEEDISKVVAIEQPFYIPFGSVCLTGRIDLVILDKQGGAWIVDHKTTGQRVNEAMLPLDAQMKLYAMAYQLITGKPVQGVYYNALLKKAPAVPMLLKSGKLSTAKIDTTAAVFREAIRQYGLNEGDYTGTLNALHAKGNTFFQRWKLRYNTSELSSAEQQLRAEVAEMHSDPAIYPNQTRDCAYCAFRPLCLAEDRGDDTEYIKHTLFCKRTVESY